MQRFWTYAYGDSSIIGLAIHAGHDLRPDLLNKCQLDAETRTREEDPHTDQFAQIVPSFVINHKSRFEVDLNRPMDTAFYRSPEQSWGLEVWNDAISQSDEAHSLRYYHSFYGMLERYLEEVAKEHHMFVLLDFHSYNHRRSGPESPPEDPLANPEINIGTGSLPKEIFAPVVNGFRNALRSFDFGGRQLDVRENVKFRGRHLAAWAHARFPGQACVLAIETKKFFMDEWTGEVDEHQLDLLKQAYASTLPRIEEGIALSQIRQMRFAV